MAYVLTVCICIGRKHRAEPFLVLNRPVNSCGAERDVRLSVIDSDPHLKVRCSVVDKLVPRGCWLRVIVGCQFSFVTSISESTVFTLIEFAANLELVKSMLVVSLEKFRSCPIHADID